MMMKPIVLAAVLVLAVVAQPPSGGQAPQGGQGTTAQCLATPATTVGQVSQTTSGTNTVLTASGCPNHAWQKVNPNTPTYNNVVLTVPTNPTRTGSATSTPMGAIGIMVNGVALFNPSNAEQQDGVIAEAFDTCQGHPEQTGQYHYHTTPLCLISSLGGTTPNVSDWTFIEAVNANNFREWVAKWPAKGTAVRLGTTLDGFSVYSPYDESGNLIAWGGIFDGSASVSYGATQYGGSFSDVRSVLDKCNGRTGSDGVYKYYLTPSPPWSLPCLMGTVGTVRSSCTNTSCPVQAGTVAGGSTVGMTVSTMLIAVAAIVAMLF